METSYIQVQRQDVFYEIPYHWTYQKNDKNLYQLRSDMVFDLLGSLSEKSILDFGCGDARFTADLVNGGVARAVGVDISQQALRFARCLVPEGEFTHLKENTIPYSTATFDAITALDVIEHIPDPVLDVWLTELHRVLKPQGLLVVSVPSTRISVSSTHFRHYSPESLRACLDNYFQTRLIKAYLVKPWWLPEVLHKFYNFDGLWLLYRHLFRECKLKEGVYLLAVAQKSDE